MNRHIYRVPEDWDGPLPAGFRFYLASMGPDDSDYPEIAAPTIRLPEQLRHIAAGDVVSVHPDGTKIHVLFKASARHNSLLLTEQCDNYCLMCSQPPKARDDSWLFAQAHQVIDLLPDDAHSLGLTGGEPTLHPDALLSILDHCRVAAPQMQLHLLSNGRKFADHDFTVRYAAIEHQDIMVGIPIYAAEPTQHDFVVQAPGAFQETIRGILNLASLGQRVEIRVVLQKHTVPGLTSLATFIARNLPFVSQVVLMGLEMTGLAKPNAPEVWIDPLDYRSELSEAVDILDAARIYTRIYNHQLCVLPRELWPYAVQSISDWKNDYEPVCTECVVQDRCAGVFTTGNRTSRGLHAVHDVGRDLASVDGAPPR